MSMSQAVNLLPGLLHIIRKTSNTHYKDITLKGQLYCIMRISVPFDITSPKCFKFNIMVSDAFSLRHCRAQPQDDFQDNGERYDRTPGVTSHYRT